MAFVAFAGVPRTSLGTRLVSLGTRLVSLGTRLVSLGTRLVSLGVLWTSLGDRLVFITPLASPVPSRVLRVFSGGPLVPFEIDRSLIGLNNLRREMFVERRWTDALSSRGHSYSYRLTF